MFPSACSFRENIRKRITINSGRKVFYWNIYFFLGFEILRRYVSPTLQLFFHCSVCVWTSCLLVQIQLGIIIFLLLSKYFKLFLNVSLRRWCLIFVSKGELSERQHYFSTRGPIALKSYPGLLLEFSLSSLHFFFLLSYSAIKRK